MRAARCWATNSWRSCRRSAPCGRAARLPADFRAPLTGEIPVLLISGEFDPVTPPRYGDRVAAHLGHARHVVLRGQGHSLFSTGCMPKLAAQFIEGADALGLDAACLERIAPPPPFSGLHGWEP
jgi:acetyl esterase/lipase